jgi:tripartite-type tricarboxylate transporter receptor subunit TctC
MKYGFVLRFYFCLVSCALCLGYGVASAQPYPSKPIRVISPFPPGGSVDLVARMFAPKLSELLGQQVIVDDRPGASGNIGTELVARAAPDGYTLLINTIPFVANANLYKKLPYDPLKDFAPITQLTASPSMLAVHPSLPLHSVKELLALARAKPGQLNYGSAGPATNPHIAGELFNYLGKVNITVVHYKGGGPALTAAVSGEVGIVFTNFAETSAFVRSGRLRALGVTSLKRQPTMPDVPTLDEAGVKGYEFVTWHGLWAPKGTPAPVIALVNERMKKALAGPDQVKMFADRGLDIVTSSPEDFTAHVAAEYAKWGKVFKERGMKVE